MARLYARLAAAALAVVALVAAGRVVAALSYARGVLRPAPPREPEFFAKESSP